MSSNVKLTNFPYSCFFGKWSVYWAFTFIFTGSSERIFCERICDRGIDNDTLKQHYIKKCLFIFWKSFKQNTWRMRMNFYDAFTLILFHRWDETLSDFILPGLRCYVYFSSMRRMLHTSCYLYKYMSCEIVKGALFSAARCLITSSTYNMNECQRQCAWLSLCSRHRCEMINFVQPCGARCLSCSYRFLLE